MTDRKDIIGDGERAMISLREIEALYRSRKTLMLIAARGLHEARRQYSSNRDFGQWLLRSPYAPLSRNERASLISIARNEKRLAKFLKTTDIVSPVRLWRTARLAMKEGQLP